MKRVIASISIRMTTDVNWQFAESVFFQESPIPEGYIRTTAIRRQEWEDLGSPEVIEVIVTAVESA